MKRYIRASMELGLGNYKVDILPLFFIALIVFLAFLKYRKRSLSYLICVFVFGTYLLYALSEVFFPMEITSSMGNHMREYYANWNHWDLYFNLTPYPFYESPYGQDTGYLHNMMLNVLLTIPLGFGIHFIRQVSAKQTLWLAIGVGLVIESTQLLISLLLRYPYRYIDINDVLMNMLGVLIGYGLFRLFGWLFVWITQRLDIQHMGLGAYIYSVVEEA